MLTGVGRHDRERKGQGDAPRAGLCSQAALCPFLCPRLEQDGPIGTFIPVYSKQVCKAELPSDCHGLAHGDCWLAELLKEGKTKSPVGFPQNLHVFRKY